MKIEKIYRIHYTYCTQIDMLDTLLSHSGKLGTDGLSRHGGGGCTGGWSRHSNRHYSSFDIVFSHSLKFTQNTNVIK